MSRPRSSSGSSPGTSSRLIEDTAWHPSPASNCYTRRQRLLKGEQFNAVFKRNKRSNDHCFIVLARPNHLPYARLGLAISRKAAGDAVPRNRLKRLIRESFRTHNLPGMDCVVMARPGAARQNNNTLLKSLDRHWSRVEVVCKKSS